MSLKDNESPFFGNALIGACCAIAASVPVSAYVASFIGDSYEVRVMVYGAILLWVISGAITIFFKTYKSEKKRLFIKVSYCCGSPLSGCGLYWCFWVNQGNKKEARPEPLFIIKRPYL